MALPKKNRLKKKKDFEEVFKKGKAFRGNFLFVRYLKNDLQFPRFAFIISAKVSKKAVVRNHIRRYLSEAVRIKLKNIPPRDIVMIADKKIADAPREKIVQDTELVLIKIS